MKHHEKTLVEQLEVLRLRQSRPMFGAEIGVWKGHLSATLLGNFSDLRLLMVDPWDSVVPRLSKSRKETEEAYEEAIVATGFAGFRAIVRRRTSEQAAKEVDDGCLDFVFVDALHDYDHVRQDLQLWYRKLRPGGLASGHDYNGRLDRKGINGVKLAVDEFALEHGLKVENSRITWWIWKP